MKTLIQAFMIMLAFCLSAWVEEGDSGTNKKKRASKFLVPAKLQSSSDQLRRHMATDKLLVASDGAKKDYSRDEDSSNNEGQGEGAAESGPMQQPYPYPSPNYRDTPSAYPGGERPRRYD